MTEHDLDLQIKRAQLRNLDRRGTLLSDFLRFKGHFKTFCVLLLAVFVLAIVFGGHAKAAGFKSGNALQEECLEKSGKYHNLYCLGYVAAVADSLEYVREMNKMPVCITATGVTNGQLVDVVFKYLKAHPEERHFGASGLVSIAIAEAFCPVEKGKAL
ncbi:Rap1a/Tai family immunity protein [Phyllobacterium lublinensis]|uniref:Rap1a/Tai family immunity protein n=1 Tax=Phyllobacterium lublinensis TaxID=2875708 RepID=UPI001CCE35FB|nr:Rap1a/Tai family immunity protein [Phyllobacterium sp. 2063]MBZ9654021.1 hypothetical protein [Phyllobacterium sp. 2063]